MNRNNKDLNRILRQNHLSKTNIEKSSKNVLQAFERLRVMVGQLNRGGKK